MHQISILINEYFRRLDRVIEQMKQRKLYKILAKCLSKTRQLRWYLIIYIESNIDIQRGLYLL
ncbi:hypothetical protein pb186bvf_014267 [Paramecium bursaria]